MDLRHTSRPFVRLLTVLVATLIPASLLAVEDATIVDPQLNEQAVRFVSLSTDRLTYFDADRRLQTADTDGFVLIRWDRTPRDETARLAARRERAAWPNIAELADGHVIRGRFAGVDTEGRVRWRTQSMGDLTFTLDQLRRLDTGGKPGRPYQDAPAGLSDGQDVVTLQNGDRLMGFAADFGASGMTLEVNNQPLPLSWGGVQQVWLANPARHTPGVWLRLVDGSRVLVRDLEIGSIQAIGTAFGKQIVVPIKHIAGVDFAEKHRLVRLAELSPVVTQGGTVFGVPMPPRIEDGNVHVHAPITLEFTLPKGVSRFAALAELEAGSLDWADMRLTIRADDKSTFTKRLNAATPATPINVAVDNRTLVLKLDTGENGPVLDRLIIRNAVLLIVSR